MRSTLATAALGVALLTGMSQAQAGLLGQTVSITVSMGSGPFFESEVCKEASVTSATVGAAVELQEGNYFTNFCLGLILVDIADNSIVITGLRQQDEYGDYFGGYRWMKANFVFAPGILSSIDLTASNLFVTPSPWDGSPAFLPTPTVSISGDGSTLSVHWSAIGSPEGYFEIRDGGTETFSINGGGGNEVTEPATLALLGAGLLGLAAVRRRRR